MVRYKFSKTEDREFAEVLKHRVKNYFAEQQISIKGNRKMAFKSIAILSIYIIPYIIMLLAGISNVFLLCFLWMIMGLGKAFIGTSVMHDALHGSYSDKKRVNTLMHFSALIIGVYPKTWKIQHNLLHHTYTNIEHADDDLTPIGVLRFSPNQEHKWFHRYQHIYALFFYSMVTVAWSVSKDFVKLIKYRKLGLIKTPATFWKNLALIILCKTIYFTLLLILPMMILPISNGVVLLLFLLMHVVTGITLSMIFQLAHIMPSSEFLEQENPSIPQNWYVHQLNTTSNYAMGNSVLSWLIGGLNFQVEHHLFPNICHIHYPQLAQIVQQTTKEFNLPYHYEPNMRGAIVSHFVMLRNLGKIPFS